MEDYKKRVMAAMQRHQEKLMKVTKKVNSKRNNPEQKVVHELMKWLKLNEFDVTITDSGHEEFEQGRISEYGFSDITGNTPDGVGCFIEAKAPRKLYTLRANQYFFLKRKIEKGCFACVVDSTTRLSEIYIKWIDFKKYDTTKSKEYLLQMLPEPKAIREMEKRPLNSRDIPF